MTEIKGFFGEYRFLSNFYPSVVKGFPTVEHAFQAAKTLIPDEQELVKSSSSPSIAKARGKQVTLRDGWEKIKIGIMRELITLKFADKELRKKLLATGESYLEETNTWRDTFWGVCNGVGENWLGKLLMEERTLARTVNLGEPPFVKVLPELLQLDKAQIS